MGKGVTRAAGAAGDEEGSGVALPVAAVSGAWGEECIWWVSSPVVVVGSGNAVALPGLASHAGRNCGQVNVHRYVRRYR
ncbi:hypothetical protein OR61_10485 [Xanthomonas vesicatoria]|uniref:Uncharacterized protein n=1 Tax=Xanthomonas vesicatoria TaxID=56460 RepID=A0AAJ0IZ72_9XANT|nr:hypothetical protein OR61_10485 [Xanthomonas vesicatoria]